MEKFIRIVTITGIDKHTSISKLQDLQAEFPFVEWGVLMSESKEGLDNRYPSLDHIEKLRHRQLNLSGHLGGAWARDVAEGGYKFIKERNQLLLMFNRIQLNISNILNHADSAELKNGVDSFIHPRIIIQIGKNGTWGNQLKPIINKVDILFDGSGGRGTVPEFWPYPLLAYDTTVRLRNCGYAGGLNIGNLEEQIQRIKVVSMGMPIWIDTESGVRTDEVLDLDKVRQFLTIAKPYVLDGNDDANNSNTEDNSISSGPTT